MAKRRLNKLTENEVKAAFSKARRAQKALPEDQRTKVGVCYHDGMFLCIQKTGTADWHQKYTIDGRQKEISLLVSYPLKGSLALAYKRHEEVKAQLEAGQDPSDVRQVKRAENSDTVIAVANLWFANKKKKGVSDATLLANRRRLEKFVYPELGRRPIRNVKANELLKTLEAIVDGEKGVETSRRVRSLCSGIWQYAVRHNKADANIAHGLQEELSEAPVRHFSAIKAPREFGELLRTIDGYSGMPITKLALQLMAHVFVRSAELRNAYWSEFDLESVEAVWRIPGARMKMKDPHIVPLSPAAVKILEELRIHSAGRLLFPSIRGGGKSMSENTLSAALKSLGYDGSRHTVHGFRASASTLLNELGHDKDCIELQLAHQERNESRASYNFADKMAERRKMMNAWSDYIESLRSGGNVVPIRKSA